MISRDFWIIVICLSIMGSVGIYSDLFLSLEAYNTNPEIFIEYEANQEIINWFTNDGFPLIFMLSVISLPFVIFVFLGEYEKHKNIKHANLYLAAIVTFVYFVFWTRLFAGLTWYLPTYYICKTFQIIATGLFMLICFYIFYYFPKQANSFPFKRRRVHAPNN